MNVADLSKLPDYLQRQRWFGSKGLPIKDISIVDQLEIKIGREPAGSLGPFVLAIIEVAYDLGSPERYQLLVCPQADGSMPPATEDDEFARELLHIIREGRTIPSGTGSLRGETFSGSQERLKKLPTSPGVRRISGEQSNTCLVFGDHAILKLIRKIDRGLNPELEMGRFLAMHPRFEVAPLILGVIELNGPASATLAVLHEFVHAESDGWNYTLAAFRASPSPDPALLKQMTHLGSRLAELHLTLSLDSADPAFAPEPIQKEDLQRWSSSIIGELGVTLAEAEKRIQGVGDLRGRLEQRARRLAQVRPSGKKIRIHGDLHLGQVLRVRDGWMIFDFEGEPARSFNQRREKLTTLKDVAGMLRSFVYAESAVEFEGAPPGNRAKLCRDSFLEGYRRTIGSSDLLPGEDGFLTVLESFELERAVYELRYELKSRPDWVRIPIRILKEMGKAL
jgi:trehalose synthase-fused probable maltokinase